MKDHQLLDAVGAGAGAGLAELFRRHGAAVYDLARLLTGAAAAREVVEDVFVCLWRRSGRLEDVVDSVRLGLLAMTRRRCAGIPCRSLQSSWPHAGGGGTRLRVLAEDHRMALTVRRVTATAALSVATTGPALIDRLAGPRGRGRRG